MKNSTHPKNLKKIIDFFESLNDDEKRENLLSYANKSKAWEPLPDQNYDLDDIQKDKQCLDTVGIHLKVIQKKVFFNISMGPKVQTLTRSLASILCEALEGVTIEQVLELKDECISQIVGEKLVQLRSQTVYYIIHRMRSAVLNIQQ
ncbi:MAG: Fe-S metabolism protein SufE [Verrucomicrobiales bacterium]|nr:Fe-S metabolism protein SufE [Verrucomicrobiales bacterium]